MIFSVAQYCWKFPSLLVILLLIFPHLKILVIKIPRSSFPVLCSVILIPILDIWPFVWRRSRNINATWTTQYLIVDPPSYELTIYRFSKVSTGMLHPQRIYSLNKKITFADLGKLTLSYFPFYWLKCSGYSWTNFIQRASDNSSVFKYEHRDGWSVQIYNFPWQKNYSCSPGRIIRLFDRIITRGSSSRSSNSGIISAIVCILYN